MKVAPYTERLRHLWADSLYRNSGHLMLSMVVTSGCGFVFWQLCAHTLSRAQVGTTATLISSAMLLATFGLVGMDMAVLHYINRWPDAKGATASTGLGVVLLTTGVCATIFVLGARVFAPSLALLQRPPFAIAFVVLTAVLSTNIFADSLFVALRESRFVLIRTIVVNAMRLAGPLLVAGLLSFAVFAVYAGAAAISLAIAVIVLQQSLRLGMRARISGARLRSMWRFSAGNYVALTVSGLPVFVLPILVANTLGTAEAALWFMAALISGLLTSIPQATTQSFYAELTAHPESTREQLIKVLRVTVMYDAVGLAGLLALGWPALALFGGSYTDAYPTLALLSVAGAVASIGYVGRTLLLASGRLRVLTAYSTVFCVLVLACTALALSHGIVAAGVAWLVGESLASLPYVNLIRVALREGSLPSEGPRSSVTDSELSPLIGGTHA